MRKLVRHVGRLCDAEVDARHGEEVRDLVLPHVPQKGLPLVFAHPDDGASSVE